MISDEDRVFNWRDHASLWFSLGVGLLVIQTGACLVPAAGGRDAALAILIGSLAGSGLLAWTAKLGCDSGLTSAGLMRATYGTLFSRLPVLLNIAQLAGWTAFELVVMRDGTAAIARRSFGSPLYGPAGSAAVTLLWGFILALLLAGSMTGLVRRIISRFGLPLVILSLVWLTWQFGRRSGAGSFYAFWTRPGDGSMGLPAAMDLVIAMPVSWLPLVADYSRHGRSGSAALSGTWLGYAAANIWCYALGILIAGAAGPGSDMVGALLLAQGGLIALSLILVDEIDNAYGDIYSGAVSAHSLKPSVSIRKWGLGLAVLCTILALALPIRSLEPFLILLSSIFVPLYGVILGRLGSAGRSFAQPPEKINIKTALLWLGGVAAYHAISRLEPGWGAALPTLALTFVLARLSGPGQTYACLRDPGAAIRARLKAGTNLFYGRKYD